MSDGAPGVDGGTALGLRFDGRIPFRSFRRSCMLIRPSPRLAFVASTIKAHALIADGEMNLIRCSPQSHFEVPYSTVFGRIVQSFLQHSKEAK